MLKSAEFWQQMSLDSIMDPVQRNIQALGLRKGGCDLPLCLVGEFCVLPLPSVIYYLYSHIPPVLWYLMMKQARVCLALFLMAGTGLALAQLGSFLVLNADSSICLLFSLSRKLEPCMWGILVNPKAFLV